MSGQPVKPQEEFIEVQTIFSMAALGSLCAFRKQEIRWQVHP